MNPNLNAVLKFFSYVSVIGAIAAVEYIKVVYPAYDSTLVLMALTSVGTGLGIFHSQQGSPKSNDSNQSTGETK